MKIIDTSKFSWNEFEQNLFQDGKWDIPSKYKIKINDSSEKRYKLEMILYKMSHKYVARWALENAQAFLSFIDIGDKELQESIVCETTAVLNMRIDGKLSAYELRNAGFLANKLGRMSINDLSKYSARVFAQSIATGHMRGHAIVSSDYAIKVINILFPHDNLKVEEERNRQVELANKIIVESIEDAIHLGLGLKPAFTGQGMGNTFLEYIIDFIKQHYPAKKITLSVAAFNERALKVYQRNGFSIIVSFT